MPQASDDLRDLMRMMFGSEISEGGPINFLVQRGYKLGKDWLWDLPSSEHSVMEKEELCLRFLVDEWDFGWIRQPAEQADGK